MSEENRYRTAIVARCSLAVPAPRSRPRRRGTKVTLRSTSLGKVLATSKGRTLYLYTPDAQEQAATATDACAATWTPLLTTGQARSRARALKKTLLSRRSSAKTRSSRSRTTATRSTPTPATPPRVADERRGVNGIWYVLTPQSQDLGGEAEAAATALRLH